MDGGDPDNFDRFGTLGVEEEFFVVSKGRPTSGTDDLVYGAEPPPVLDGRLDHELFTCVIETQTPLIEAVDDARGAVLGTRKALVDHAASHGYGVAAAGLHPAARWRELEHAGKPRYRSQLDRIQYPQHRNTTAGLHIHVGVDDPDAAVWVANELRWHVSVILALSANSPYWDGFDTGLQSARASVFEALPNTGIPTAFDSYEAFERFERTMLETGSIRDRGELWYDVRPHSGHGTVEVRTPDAQADPDRVLALVEYVHALVIDLATRYEDGKPGTDLRREILDQNKWRALRYGHDATLVGRNGETTRSLAAIVEREADRLGTPDLLNLLDEESGATRQRRVHRQEGPDALCRSLLLEPEKS